MKALVTGAAGFLGSQAVKRLRAEGVWVRAFVRPGRDAAADEVAFGDLRDESALARGVAGMDLVIHAGARVSTAGSWSEFEATNVQATERLIQLATAAGVRRVVHVSSLSVYAVPADGVTVTEDSPYETGAGERGLYSRSKLAADQVACRAMAAGAPVTVVRPGLLFGPGQRPPLARRAIAMGPLRVILARRAYLLPLAYVENVADALWLAARSERAAGRAYTIVDVNIPQAEYAAQYRRIAGQSWTAVYAPPGAVLAAIGLVERAAKAVGRRTPVTRHQVARAIWSARFDTQRAHEELGWRPRVAFEEALRLSLASIAPPAPDTLRHAQGERKVVDNSGAGIRSGEPVEP